MKVRYATAASIAVLIAGCASSARHTDNDVTGAELPQGEEVVLIAEEAPRVVCRREAPTGSRLKVTRCRTLQRIEQDRDAARARLRRSSSWSLGHSSRAQ